MSARIKVVCNNIELDRHRDTVSSLLKREKPDVVCLQELPERDFSYFEKLLGMTGKFVPTAILGCPGFREEVTGHPFGVGLFSRFEATYAALYYEGNPSV